MARPKHPRKGLERILKAAEQQGWAVTRSKRYFKMRCPCEDKHLKWVHMTPSNPNYQVNLVGQLLRATCWKGEAK